MKPTIKTVLTHLNEIITQHELDITLCTPLIVENMNYFIEAEQKAHKGVNIALYRHTAYMAWLEENYDKMLHH